MHKLYFVKIEKDNAGTKEEAISQANTILENENFAGEGYFNGAKCDWWAMGGRWKDIFDGGATVLTPSVMKAVKKLYGGKDDWGDITEVFLAEDYEEIPVKELSEKDLGDWLVIVDYHY